jgi:hypothetical protein
MLRDPGAPNVWSVSGRVSAAATVDDLMRDAWPL